MVTVEKVFVDFRKIIYDMAQIIIDYTEEGNRQEALSWHEDLLTSNAVWQAGVKKQRMIIGNKDFPGGDKMINTSETISMDERRFAVTQEALKAVEPRLRAKGWIK